MKAELALVLESLGGLGAPTPIETAVSGSELWATWIGNGSDIGATGASLVRVGVAPKDLAAVVTAEKRALALDSGSFVMDIANGLIYVRNDVNIAAMRSVAQEYSGYAVVLQASTVVGNPSGDGVDVWGHCRDTLNLMRALKHRWDASGTFNPDTFIV